MITESTIMIQTISYNIGVFCISTVCVYLNLDAEVFVIYATLLFIDYATGLIKAKTTNESITSTRMKYGILSKLSLLLIPIVLSLGAKALGVDFKSVLLVSLNILVLSEVYSIISNIHAIKTRQELPEFDAVAMIGKKIRNFLINIGEVK